jgi:hypothetical protein
MVIMGSHPKHQQKSGVAARQRRIFPEFPVAQTVWV